MSLFVFIISIFLLVCVITLLKVKRTTAIVIFITICYFYFLLIWFHYFKFNGEFRPLFPDETTYLTDSNSGGFFGAYISILNSIIPIEFQIGFNLIFYLIGIVILLEFSSFTFKFNLSSFIAMSLIIFGVYWCLFILKESFSIFSIIIYLISIRRNKFYLKTLAITLLILARFELALVFMVVELLLFTYSRSKFFFATIFTSIAAIVFNFFDTPFFNALKLFGMSRRFGESQKEFDEIAVSTSQLPFFKYIISEPFIETIIYNLNNGFNFVSSKGLAIPLVFLNFIGLIFIIIKFKLLIYSKEFYLFVVPFFIFNLTHSTYRYMNVLIIPFTLYYITQITNKSQTQ